MKEGKRMFILLNWFILQIISFLGYVWAMLDGPALQRTPLELEPELAGFHGFRGKTLEGLFEPLVYFSNRTGDLFFSTLPLSLSPLQSLFEEWTNRHSPHPKTTATGIIPAYLQKTDKCHCNHMICSDFRWVKRRRISHYRTICFVFNVSSTAPDKQNSKKSGI